jgi:hypothetical protein
VDHRVLRRILGLRGDEVTGGWRNLHNEQIYYLHCLPGIIRTIKSRWIRRVGHVARKGEEWNAHRILVGKPKGRDHYEDHGIDGWLILCWILGRWDRVVQTGLIWLRIWTSSSTI